LEFYGKGRRRINLIFWRTVIAFWRLVGGAKSVGFLGR
jgi:hypothetical protein